MSSCELNITTIRVYSRDWLVRAELAPFWNSRGLVFKKGDPRKTLPQKNFNFFVETIQCNPCLMIMLFRISLPVGYLFLELLP